MPPALENLLLNYTNLVNREWRECGHWPIGQKLLFVIEVYELALKCSNDTIWKLSSEKAKLEARVKELEADLARHRC
jgi:hypothetical protein